MYIMLFHAYNQEIIKVLNCAVLCWLSCINNLM